MNRYDIILIATIEVHDIFEADTVEEAIEAARNALPHDITFTDAIVERAIFVDPEEPVGGEPGAVAMGAPLPMFTPEELHAKRLQDAAPDYEEMA